MSKKLKIVGVSIFCVLLFVLLFRTLSTIEISDYARTGVHYLKNNYSVFYEFNAGVRCDCCAIGKQEIVGADPKTFEVLNRNYVRDKNHVYICSWSGDESKVATKCETTQNVDYSSFELIGDTENRLHDSHKGDYYAKDKGHVYFYGRVIENGDPQSFQIIDDEYATDKNRIYYKDNYDRFHVVKEVESASDISEYFSKDYRSVEEEMRSKLVPTMEAFLR